MAEKRDDICSRRRKIAPAAAKSPQPALGRRGLAANDGTGDEVRKEDELWKKKQKQHESEESGA